ncbi:MAG: DUF116 domain-containing protein, partial [Planctomycetota bacterium]|nr:DUF116 domain-containing protein [Planctomycetota bacterium]
MVGRRSVEKAVFTVGVVVVVAGTVFCLFYVLAAFAMCVAHKGRKPPFPTFAMFLLKFYRGMLTPIGRVLLGDGWSVEHAAISLANRLNSERYYKVGISDKIVILPQCLRDRDCKAKIDSKKGIECLNCGKCVVGRLKGAFPSLRVFVIPGGTFAKRVVEAENPKAVLGVACVMELLSLIHI